jgi:hypothetical protein
LPVIVGVLTGNVALAAADVSPATPVPTPSPTPEPAATPTLPVPPPTGPGSYVATVTTTTTIVNAPITVVAAPITTTINSMTRGNGSGGSDRNPPLERLVIDLTGCGAAGGRAPVAPRQRVRRAKHRLGRNASLVVRVNRRRVTTLRLPSSSRDRARGVALRLRLAANGMLTIRRPSGRVLAVQGCTPA